MEFYDDLDSLRSRSLIGIGMLMHRQIIIKLVNFISGIILARLLAPEIFGIYAIVTFVVQFFSIFGDIGFGAALIQKKEEISKQETSSIFWLQQILVLAIVIIIFVCAPYALKIYQSLNYDVVWLIRVMSISLIFSSLKTVPAIIMERSLAYNRIAWIDICESLIFQLVTIFLAMSNFAVWAFILGVITKSLIGAVMMFFLSSWRPLFCLDFKSIKNLIHFGFPYQLTNILNFIKDTVTPLFVGSYSGASAVGYINWAKSFAFAPLMFTQSYDKVAFPAFSRIQENRELLSKTVKSSIRCITLIMFPITTIMIALGPEITKLVFTNKWMPGIWAFYLYCTSPMITGVVLPMYSAILALGKSKIILKISIFLLFLEWGTSVPIIILFGFTGIALNQPVIAILFFFIYKHVLLREGIRLKVSHFTSCQLVAAIVVGIILKLICLNSYINLFILIILPFIGIIVYLVIIYLINKNSINQLKGYIPKILRTR